MVPEKAESSKQQKLECFIDCLSKGLIEQTFLSLPVKTLLRCSGVCKQWSSIIRDPNFVTSHLQLAARCVVLFFSRESVSSELYPSDAVLIDEAWSQSTWAVPVIGPDDFLCGSSNGLVCLYTQTTTIKIANLATGECLHLEKPVKNLAGDHFSFYSFGFHPVTKKYKVTHFLGDSHEARPRAKESFDALQVYTLGDEKWKDVGAPEALSLKCVKNSGVVNVDGTMYWLTEDQGASWQHAVMSFDLSKESFGIYETLHFLVLFSSGSKRYMERLLDFKPRKAGNMQFYTFMKSLVRLDAYKKAVIVRGRKRQEGWELKKWEASESMRCEVEDTWKDIQRMEQIILLLRRPPDDEALKRISMRIDQMLCRLPDCPNQHPRSLRRLNWVEQKQDMNHLEARVHRLRNAVEEGGDLLRMITSYLCDQVMSIPTSDTST